MLLFVDLHGHSKKSNIFMYGVENPSDVALYMRERVIPTLLDRASPLFNLKDCSFDVSTARGLNAIAHLMLLLVLLVDGYGIRNVSYSASVWWKTAD